MAVSIIARRAYVAGMRGLRVPLRLSGALTRLERSEGQVPRWARSLFAIYDFDDMLRVGLPWWTFSAISAVEHFLGTDKSKRVFEWGSGMSTVWLSQRSAQVISVESDAGWHKMVVERLSSVPSVDVRLVQAAKTGHVGSSKAGFEDQFFDDYVAAIDTESEPFDLIVIDGRARESCLERAIGKLSEDGLIVFDDTNRKRYKDAIALSGLPYQRFDGLAVSLPLPDSTTLLSHFEATLSGL